MGAIPGAKFKPHRATRGTGQPSVYYRVWSASVRGAMRYGAALLWTCLTAPRVIGAARWIERIANFP